MRFYRNGTSYFVLHEVFSMTKYWEWRACVFTWLGVFMNDWYAARCNVSGSHTFTNNTILRERRFNCRITESIIFENGWFSRLKVGKSREPQFHSSVHSLAHRSNVRLTRRFIVFTHPLNWERSFLWKSLFSLFWNHFQNCFAEISKIERCSTGVVNKRLE